MMGKTLAKLASRSLDQNRICNTRCIVECCETFHFHWRNTRLEMAPADFLELLRMFSAAAREYEGRGKPATHSEAYIPLGRMQILHPDNSPDLLRVELCQNTFRTQFRTETTFDDEEYVHIHYRDVRLEMPVPEFCALAKALSEAAATLANV
jgi:hypothetical protein